MIKVQRLSKSFGKVKAVDDISFEVKEQENLILLGTSGCGKTTTLKMINSLIIPTAGQVLINGENMLEKQPVASRRNIGYVLQNNGLFPHYTVAQNIAVVPQLLKWDKRRIQKRTHELLEKLHLSAEYMDLYPRELSGGQQQRVGLARALAADPPILLMDEPFGALDNVTRSKIHAEFKALDELKKKTIIMVTHDVEEAFELGDHICLMDNGKIVQDGTPAELLFSPSGTFVENFLKEQRLQLEFRAIRLTDIWDLLPDAESNTGSDTRAEIHTTTYNTTTSNNNSNNDTHTDTRLENDSSAIPASANIWAALERFTFTNGETLNIIHDEKKTRKTAGFEQLMSAFYKYKQKAGS